MPTFLICNDCEKERLVADEVLEVMRREEQSPKRIYLPAVY